MYFSFLCCAVSYLIHTYASLPIIACSVDWPSDRSWWKISQPLQ